MQNLFAHLRYEHNNEVLVWHQIMKLVQNAKHEFSDSLNVYNQPLQICGKSPLTGWYRNGFCETDDHDHGTHTVCAEVTPEFLVFSRY